MSSWESVSNLFIYIRDEYGYDFTVFHDAYFASKYVAAIIETVKISLVVLVVSFAIGFLLGSYRFIGGRSRRVLIDGYVALFRNTPALAQLYFFYFGIGSIVVANADHLFGIAPYLGGFFWLVLALSLHFGAYNVEAVRAGLEAVPKNMIEAAQSLGYSPSRIMWRIQIPLALRIVLPSLSNNLVQIIKTTAVGYAVAVPEILYVANRIWAEQMNVAEMMNIVLLSYLTLIGIAVFLTYCLERALRIPGMRG